MRSRHYTYAELATHLGITRCRGIDPRTGARCYEDHEAGTWAEGMIHWGERERVLKSGIRRFLLLASNANPIVANTTPGWQQLFMANSYAAGIARSLGIRIPAAFSNFDRRRVRVLIVDLPPETPLRKEAMQWALQADERQAGTAPPARAGTGAPGSG